MHVSPVKQKNHNYSIITLIGTTQFHTEITLKSRKMIAELTQQRFLPSCIELVLLKLFPLTKRVTITLFATELFSHLENDFHLP